MPQKPTSSKEYLATLDEEQRSVVERLCTTVRDAVPSAQEAFSYGMPGFTVDGQPLVWVAAWKRHFSVYPVSAEQLAAVALPGEKFEVEKGTLRFDAGAPPPYDLLTRLARARAQQLASGGR